MYLLIYDDIKLIEEKLLKKNKKKIRFNSFRFGTIAGVSRGMRFHTAINKFCLNAALNNYLNGIGLDEPLQEWFDFKVSKTLHSPNLISNSIIKKVNS